MDITWCIYRFRYTITEFLLENKINKHAVSHSGITPMAIAVEHLNPAMVRILIKYGYNMNKVFSCVMCCLPCFETGEFGLVHKPKYFT